MRKIVLILFSALFFAFGCSSKKRSEEALNVATLNLRIDTTLVDSSFVWSDNAMPVYDFLQENEYDLLGLQYVSLEQIKTIDSVLTGFEAVGIGGVDGEKEGFMNPLFYKRDKFDMVRTKTFWLFDISDSVESEMLNPMFSHMLTWIELVEKKTQEHLFFFNTSFPEDSDSILFECANFLLRVVDSLSVGNKFVITGDFGMRRGNAAYEKIIGPYESVPMCADTYVASSYEGIDFFRRITRGLYINKTKDFVFVRNGMAVNNFDVLEIPDAKSYLSVPWIMESEIVLK
ncbi:MAG: hypothetical protein J6X26_05260 [Bacteroidales bacterium]|nr:hypothetical protein [Bacteroidales bacterium]